MTLVLRLLSLVAVVFVALGYGPPPNPNTVFQVADSGNLVKLMKMAKAGADLQARDEQGRSLLYVAAARANSAMVRYLLGQNLDVDARTMRGETSLHVAAINGDVRTANLLLGAGASPRAYTKKCMSPLDYAAGFGQPAVFKLLQGPTAKSPLPADGTIGECGLKVATADYETTRTRFHRRNLRIATMEDYLPAAETLTVLTADPDLGARFIPEILAAVDRPSIPGTEAKGLYDSLHRDMAVKALHKVARTKAQKDQVARGLLAILERGPCPVYTATVCAEASCAPLGASRLVEVARSVLHKKQTWPRSQEDEVCYNCATCEETRIGNAYAVTLAWFAANKTYLPQAEAVLRRQGKAKQLTRDDLQFKLRALSTKPAGF